MHEVTIPGPEGRLEARYNQGDGKAPPLALLLHPHPKFGGNMNSKVIYNCFKTFSDMQKRWRLRRKPALCLRKRP